MQFVKRIISLLISFIVPPVAVYMMRGVHLGFVINLLLFVCAQGVFWFAMAGVGLALWGLAIVHALVLSLLPVSRVEMAKAGAA